MNSYHIYCRLLIRFELFRSSIEFDVTRVIKVYSFLAIVVINRDHQMHYSYSNPACARDVIEITREKISFALAFASVSTLLF